MATFISILFAVLLCFIVLAAVAIVLHEFSPSSWEDRD